ncbi:MAG: general secretion pathway protein D [Marinobacter sp. T13-3]|mgnify:CR=1 FL=1|nr:MAG: general secretion pathway protein D [Marinobacter sp. T13-3]
MLLTRLINNLLHPGRLIRRLFAALILTGVLVAPFTAKAENTWQLNLKDAEIGAFVEQVADITGYNFVVDPRVKGKVTVLSKAPMNQAEIYDLFLSVLDVHGFTAVSGEEAIKIIQQVDAKQSGENLNRFGDTPPSEQLVTQVIQVEEANALELVPTLRPLVAKYGHLAAVPGANALIISDLNGNIDRLRRLVRSLDQPSDLDVDVIDLKEAWVGDLAPMLEELAPLSVAGGNEKLRAANKITADERTNSLIVHGTQSFRDSIYKLVTKLDKASANRDTTRVLQLNHADAENLTEILTKVLTRRSEGGNGQDSFSVIADKGLNTLVIRGEPSLMREAEQIVAQLDIRRAQVMIEAAIVEISDETGKSAGVQLAAGDKSNGSVPVLGTNLTSDNGMLGLNSVISALVGNTLPQLASGLTFGAGESRDNGASWGILIQALNSSAAANLLSTPSLITLDNQESEIIVGQNVPFRTGQSTVTGDGTTNPFTTIERRDIGLTLKVTPSISQDGLVRLQVEQTTENLARTNLEGAADLITNKRSIKTTVLADDQETIVLGGLTRDDLQVTTSKVPLLGDIPGLGRLFTSESKQWVKRDLVIFLRPSIMLDKADTGEITQKRFDAFYDIDLATREKLSLPSKPEPVTADDLFMPN